MLVCRVCGCENSNTISEMTDGRSSFMLCDDCRELVRTFYFVYHNLPKAVSEARQAKTGKVVWKEAK